MNSSISFGLLVLGLIALGSCQDFRTAGVNQHNFYRAKHGGPNVSGDNTIHTSAQKWADYLASNNKFEHSGGKYGENIYKSWGGSKDLNKAVQDAVTSWYNEINKYDFNKPGFSSGTGHFTQVVWKASTKVGIGAALASDPKYGYSITVVAQYNPPGNMGGNNNQYYRDNVVPPK